MDLAFGEAVFSEARKLAASGKDPNQIANILFQKDPAGHNYGIGIMLGGDGKPLRTSPTLLEYFRSEIDGSQSGSYMNSAALIEEMRRAVLAWQRVPEDRTREPRPSRSKRSDGRRTRRSRSWHGCRRRSFRRAAR
jgi:hypothetical protein